jgi:hypothetical protein
MGATTFCGTFFLPSFYVKVSELGQGGNNAQCAALAAGSLGLREFKVLQKGHVSYRKRLLSSSECVPGSKDHRSAIKREREQARQESKECAAAALVSRVHSCRCCLDPVAGI